MHGLGLPSTSERSMLVSRADKNVAGTRHTFLELLVKPEGNQVNISYLAHTQHYEEKTYRIA
jgi:hypothetical protein